MTLEERYTAYIEADADGVPFEQWVKEGECMAIPTEGTLAVAEKLAELVLKSPAGGLFHEAAVPTVSGVEVADFAGLAWFQIELPNGDVFEVVVKRQR